MVWRIPLLAGIVLASPLQAQPAPGATIGLSDAQKADILSHDSEASVDAARGARPDAGLPGSGTARGIHGEIGAGIGTNGYRSAYGAAAIPLGDHAGATVMVESDRYGHR